MQVSERTTIKVVYSIYNLSTDVLEASGADWPRWASNGNRPFWIGNLCAALSLVRSIDLSAVPWVMAGGHRRLWRAGRFFNRSYWRNIWLSLLLRPWKIWRIYFVCTAWGSDLGCIGVYTALSGLEFGILEFNWLLVTGFFHCSRVFIIMLSLRADLIPDSRRLLHIWSGFELGKTTLKMIICDDIETASMFLSYSFPADFC